MDPAIVRERAERFCAALLDGDMTRAAESLSHELQTNLGPLVAILPLPSTEATVESIEVGGSGYVALIRLVGSGGAVELRTRWKERDGQPTMVEASHVAEPPPPPEPPVETGSEG